MKVMLSSILAEPNRWTADKIPFFALKDLLAGIKGAGFSAVEVWQNHLALLDQRGVRELKSAAAGLGMEFPAVGIYPEFHLDPPGREAGMEKILSVVEKASDTGASILKTMPGRVPGAELSPELERKSKAFVEDLLDATEKYGMVFAFETHSGTLADDPEILLSFIGDIGSERLKVCWQPYDPKDTDGAIRLFDRLSPLVVQLHLQGRSGGEMVLLENADIDYARVLRHVTGAGFDGCISIEFTKDCVADSPESFDLDRVLANAGRDLEYVMDNL